MNKHSMLSTSEFARLCNTTKQTLLYYDKKNLLKPKHICDNGYRRYGVEQFMDFDRIRTFKETGSTLKEIKTHIRNVNGEAFLDSLEKKRLILKKERERLAQREMMLQDMAVYTREALDFDYDVFMVQQQEEERLEAIPTMSAPLESEPEWTKRIIEYIAFIEKKKRIPRYPFGAIVNINDVAQGKYLEKYFFSRATRATPRSKLHVKPAGYYAVLAHKGTTHMHQQTYSKLLKKIKDDGLSIAGNAYIYDMMSHALCEAGNTFATKYCIAVQRDK